MLVILGTRGSPLALWQTAYVRKQLEAAGQDLYTEKKILKTVGDKVTDTPLAWIGDRGLFTAEIDRAVLSGTVDAAVHSLKDLPTQLAEGLTLAAVLAREDARDAFVPAPERARSIMKLPKGATIGTSSLRRRAQIMELRPDLKVQELRGNLGTRLDRVMAGDFDATIVAMAGLRRLQLDNMAGTVLEPPEWLPAAGQGALAVLTREGDHELRERLKVLDEPELRSAVTAERSFLRALEGGCQVPIGALALPDGPKLKLYGFVAALDGSLFLRGDTTGSMTEAASLGIKLADQLRQQGADQILQAARQQGIPPFPDQEER